MEKARALRVVTARAAGERIGNETANIMMALRKASIHPLLFRRLYNDKNIAKMSKACLGEDEYQQSNVELVYEDMEVMTDMELHRFCEHHPRTMTQFLLQDNPWMDSGKVSKLASLLQIFKKNGDRVLVFSQFVMVLDILEAVMETLAMQFFRLDGSTPMEQRQDMIDQFYDEEDITVFLLSTGAGGAGINLACKLVFAIMLLKSILTGGKAPTKSSYSTRHLTLKRMCRQVFSPPKNPPLMVHAY